MSEEKAVWNETMDTGTCKTCGGDIEFRGYFWDHVDNTQCENLDIILDSVKRKTAVSGDQSPSNPPYSAWLKIMRADGWNEGSAAAGWSRTSVWWEGETRHSHIEILTDDAIKEYFRKGETPPPLDWEDLPFSEPVGEQRPPLPGNL